MQPVVTHTNIAKSRQEIFDYLTDLSKLPCYTDHFIDEYRLTRVDPVGRGAGVRFHAKAPFRRYSWADLTLVQLEAPYRITAAGRGGKVNRVRLVLTATIEEISANLSKLQITVEIEPATLPDRIFNPLGSRRWITRKIKKTARRVRKELEDNSKRRAVSEPLTVAGS